MKAYVKKSIFLKALIHGQSVIDKKSAIPMLGYTQISASRMGLSLTTTDMNMTLMETIQAEIEEDGSFCVPMQLLCEITRKLNDCHLIVLSYDYDKCRLTIVSGKSIFEVACLSSAGFPSLAQNPIEHQIKLKADLLKNLLGCVKFAMSTDDSRYVLNGIFVQSIEGGIRAVATDMHRMACAEDLVDNVSGVKGITIGRKAVNEIIKLLDGYNDNIILGCCNSMVEISFENPQQNVVLTSSLIEGEYPDYRAALDVNCNFRAVLNTKDLKETVDRVGVFSSERVKTIKLLFKTKSNNLILSAINPDHGMSFDEIDVQIDTKNYLQCRDDCDEDLEMCLNVRYLLDSLSQINSENVEFLFAENFSVILRPIFEEKKENILCEFVIMSMRE